MVTIPKPTKFLGLAALLLVVISAGFIIIGLWYEAAHAEFIVPEEVVGETWIRIGEIIFLLAVALIIAGVRLWLHNRDTATPKHLL
jgi:hypothetical protein